MKWVLPTFAVRYEDVPVAVEGGAPPVAGLPAEPGVPAGPAGPAGATPTVWACGWDVEAPRRGTRPWRFENGPRPTVPADAARELRDP
mgnify:CR=1 FL=1